MVGIAIKGLGLLGKLGKSSKLSKKKRGDFAMKNFKKRLQKTPNKILRQDKTYELSTGKFGKIISGKKQKKKILKQQHSIKRKWEATGDEWGPWKYGAKAKGGRV